MSTDAQHAASATYAGGNADTGTGTSTSTSTSTSTGTGTGTSTGTSTSTSAPTPGHTASATYTGPDRRHPMPEASFRPYLPSIAATGIVVISVWSALAILALGSSPAAATAFAMMTNALSGALLLAAAALLYAAWRITGTARVALGTVALALVGMSFPLIGMISAVTGGVLGEDTTAALTRVLLKIAVVGLAVAALRTSDINARIHPLRLFAVLLTGLVALMAVATVIDVSAISLRLTGLVTALQLGVAAAWAVVGAAFLRSGSARHARSGTTKRATRRRTDLLVGCGMIFLAFGALGRARFGPLTIPHAVIGSGMNFVLASVVITAAGFTLWRLHTGRATRLLTTTGELQGARIDLERLELDEQQRLHDARNAMLGLSGAARLLARGSATPTGSTAMSRYDDSRYDEQSWHDAILAEPTTDDAALAADAAPSRVEQMMLAELTRLEHMLDPTTRHTRRSAAPFEPASVIEPLILTHQLAGARIAAKLTACRALGDAEATANAVSNVLINAQRHAPGAHIWVHTHAVDDGVAIEISDDGPGIPRAEREAVTRPGVRGEHARAPGSGIGLASVASALSDQGGTLRISERKGGGTMITLTLPQARPQVAERGLTGVDAAKLDTADSQDVAQVAAPVKSHTVRRYMSATP